MTTQAERFSLTNEHTERILHLLRFLLANKSCTRQDIFEHLTSHYRLDDGYVVSQGGIKRSASANRMLDRDLNFLEAQGYHIEKKRVGREATRYTLARDAAVAPLFVFNDTEVDSLALLFNLFAASPSPNQSGSRQTIPPAANPNPYATDVLTLLQKLVESLPPHQLKLFQRMIAKPPVHLSLATAIDYLPYRATIDKIEQAILQRHKLSFEYQPTDRREKQILHPKVIPYRIWYMEDHVYLLGYSDKTTEFYEYRLDRIVGESLKILPEMKNTEYQPRLIEFTYWIDEKIAKHGMSQRWVEQWVEREEVTLDEQGHEKRRVLVRARHYSEWRIVRQLLKYGEQAELASGPASLMARMPASDCRHVQRILQTKRGLNTLSTTIYSLLGISC